MTATGDAVGGVHGRPCRSGATGRAQRRGFAAALGLLADRALGEPPAALHPVALFGRVMTALESAVRTDVARPSWSGSDRVAGAGPGDRRGAGPFWSRTGRIAGAGSGDRGEAHRFPWRHGRVAGAGSGAGGEAHRFPWRHGRVAGAGYAAAGIGLGWGAGSAVGPSVPAGTVATWLVVAGRALGEEATAIGARLAADDLDGARRRLPALVGRDPDSLDAKGVARAVVESVAENTVDAVVAPACWAAALGAAGAGMYRAVNTLDAMVGHRNERYARFGWAAARLDDAANWLPARLAGLLVAAVRPGQAREVLAAMVHPPAHPSPNAGVVEAAFAAALGLRLGGDTVYAGRVDPRPAFGSGRPPEPGDIDAAVRLSRDVTLALAALLAAPAVVGGLVRRRRPQPAFLYRNGAENERRLAGSRGRPATGVPLPEYSGKRTPVASSGTAPTASTASTAACAATAVDRDGAPATRNWRSFTGMQPKTNAGRGRDAE